jgi:hypothetical protein
VAKKRDHLRLVEKGTAPSAESAGTVPTAEIDELYQKPLGEFTAARNALAKRLGTAGGDIKTLEKPGAAAWGVNQLYWRERADYDHLIEAAEALRAEHRNHLSGKAADIRQAEKTHREAVRAAADTVHRLLAESGDAATPATMTAVTETLEALPASEAPGRLVKALKPQGFAALAGLAGLTPRPVSPIKPSKGRDESPAKADAETAAAHARAEAARRAAEAAEREAEEERQKRREAHATAIRDAEAEVDRARQALDEAHQEVERRSEALAVARENLRQLKRVMII